MVIPKRILLKVPPETRKGFSESVSWRFHTLRSLNRSRKLLTLALVLHLMVMWYQFGKFQLLQHLPHWCLQLRGTSSRGASSYPTNGKEALPREKAFPACKQNGKVPKLSFLLDSCYQHQHTHPISSLGMVVTVQGKIYALCTSFARF